MGFAVLALLGLNMGFAVLGFAVGGLELFELVEVLPQSLANFFADFFFLFLCLETEIEIKTPP